MTEPRPQFSPLTVATRRTRIVVAMVGPLLWLVACIVLAVVGHETRAIAFGSFLVALAALVPMRRRRVREEAEGEPTHDH